MTTPFIEEEFTFTNPDGSTIDVVGTGNQYYATFETVDGFTVVKDPVTGYYKYAQLSDDKNELLPVEGNIEDVNPTNLGLKPHLRLRSEKAKELAQTASARQGQKMRWQVRREEKSAQLKARSRSIMTGAEAMPRADDVVGNYVGLCILIEFPDVPSTISRQEVNNFCNQTGYSGYGNNGSVRDYFHDNSKGNLNYTNVVTQYYTAQNNRSYYTDPSIPFGTRARELITEALDDLKSQNFNFNQLTSDSNGYIYALNVFYVDRRVNNWSEGLWPHQWGLASAYNTGTGKRFSDYQITDMSNELSLRTFCHENGHMICDFPDLYDYGGESRGVGHFCLMCAGGNNKNPVQIGAYLKNDAGWSTSLAQVTPGITASLTASENDFYIHSKNATEYFIIENRQRTGRDSFIPDDGLAIWHIEENGNNSNEQMTESMHYICSLEQADGQFHMEDNVNSGDSDDLFSAPNNTEFSNSTSPNSRWWDGSNSDLKLSNISASGAVMSFDVSGTAQWFYGKSVRYVSGNASTKWAHAIIEDIDGWRRIAPTSVDGVTNVLTILNAANANNRLVNVYVGADGQIHGTYMS